MNESPLPELTETEYLRMEEALSQTARGRAFLRMRDRRSRVVAVDEFQRIASALDHQVKRLSAVGSVGGPAGHMSGAVSPSIERELASIAEFVQQTRSDVAALRPADTGANRIEAATGELDAIVGATERATTDILNAVERISEWNARIPRGDPDLAEIADAIEAWVIEILTACSFQDITGQRTTKVVNTLRYIEQRVNTMIEIWGVDKAMVAAGAADVVSHRKLNDDRPDAHLLNGPALGDGVDQAAIDALFDSIATEMPQVFDRAEPAVAAPAKAPAPERPPAAAAPAPPAAGESGGAGISQADIDALFA